MVVKMRIFLVVSLSIFFALPIAYGDGTIVYDNSSSFTYSTDPNNLAPDGFLPFSVYSPNELMGDEIILAGTNRQVVRFDLILSSTEPTELDTLSLVFREADFPEPGPVLWSGILHDIYVDGITTVTFDIPNVVVPDTFIWLASSDSVVAGLATYDPPTVGESWDEFWDYTKFTEKEGLWGLMALDPDPDIADPVANFGATVWAVPEPTVLGSLLFSGIFLAGKKRRK